MSRMHPLILVACAAVLGATFAAAVAPPAAFAKDEKKDAAKDAREAEERKKKRDAYREKVKKELKLPFFDLSYAADTVAAKESRWSQTDPPHPQATEEQGLQFNAAFSLDAAKGAAITMRVQKMIHKSLDGKSEYSYPFEKAGMQPKCADMPKICEGFFKEWMKELKGNEAKSVEPKKSNVGPADMFLSVVGTNSDSQKRERRDLYAWLGPNTTWVVIFEYTDKVIDEPSIIEKAAEFLATVKELKSAPK